VSAEVVATDTEGMIKEAEAFLPIAPNITIKLPCTVDGVRACKMLSDRGVSTNMTLCFQPLQALVVAKAGAAFVSPFVGRFDDIAERGMDLVTTIRQIYDNYGFKTQILAASIRSSLHLVEAAVAGADVATVPYPILEKMLHHPLTDVGLAKFEADWQKHLKEMKK
jgi:transaldolase